MQPSTSDHTQHISGTMYPTQLQPGYMVVSPYMGFPPPMQWPQNQCMQQETVRALAGQCPHWQNSPPTDTGTQVAYDRREDLAHKPGHAHCPHRLFHGFFDTYPDSRHGPARPIRSARTPCSHPTSAADKPTHPANHRTASPLWRSPHPSITMPRARAHQPSDRGTPCIPAPRPTIAIRPARPSGFVGPAVRPPFCV